MKPQFKRLIPRRIELATFGMVAVACAAMAALTSVHEFGLMIFGLPIFMFAAWMGMRRSGQWSSLDGGMVGGAEGEVDGAGASGADDDELVI